jgi:DivIVA domain-containing protein
VLTLAGYGLLAVLVGVVLFLVAAYLLPPGEQIAPPVRDEPIWTLPAERALSADDVTRVRLPIALRGYRFAETDLLLDRLADELRERDAEIERLRPYSGPARPGDPPFGDAPAHLQPPPGPYERWTATPAAPAAPAAAHAWRPEASDAPDAPDRRPADAPDATRRPDPDSGTDQRAEQ